VAEKRDAPRRRSDIYKPAEYRAWYTRHLRYRGMRLAREWARSSLLDANYQLEPAARVNARETGSAITMRYDKFV